MTDIDALRAHLQELAASAPASKPIDRATRQRIRVRQGATATFVMLSVVTIALTGLTVVSAEGIFRDRAPDFAGRTEAPPEPGCIWTIATMGALSGDYASLGQPIAEAIEFAVHEANEQTELGCELAFRREDSQGNPNKAPSVAGKIVNDLSVVACICPYFSGETLASGNVFREAGMLMSGFGSNDTLDDQGLTNWFGAVAPDNLQAAAAAQYMLGTGARRVAVVHDDQDYSRTMADVVMTTLGDVAVGPFVVEPGQEDHSRVVAQVQAAQPDFVFFGGYTPEAGPLARQLHQAGVDATFVTDAGSKDPLFGRLAGAGASGTIALCACVDPVKIESADNFVQGMRAEYGNDSPGTFGTEAYDVTRLVVAALEAYQGEATNTRAVRKHVVEWFANTDSYRGLAKLYSWRGGGELHGGADSVWAYEWNSRADDFVALGPVADLVNR